MKRRLTGFSSAAIKNPRMEAFVFRRRAALAFVAALLATVMLATGYARLQAVEHEQYRTRSESNRIKARPILPERGLILDRNGELLADNRPAYRLELIPEQVADLAATLDGLAELIGLGSEERERFEQARRAARAFNPVPVRYRLSEAEVARFAVNRHRFPGVDVVPYLSRHYPHRELLAHALGYVGQPAPEDLVADASGRTAILGEVGKAGIERRYETLLRGEPGFERVEQNARGRDLRIIERIPPRAGNDLILSIDIGLQSAAVAAFGNQHGAAVAVDPRSGEVLALVSLPSFDPNRFIGGISRSDYAALVQSPSRPLFDRAVQGGYEPGSTIKPFIALAGLETGLRRADQPFLSTGAFTLPGQPREYRDWRKGGHGWVDVRAALEQSVNTYFYRLAHDLGIDRISEQMRRYGFGEPTGIDLPGEAVGILPSRAWKQAVRNQPWFPGETVISGIGQGFWVTTPLQLARATAALADGGRLRSLHLLRARRSGPGEPVEVVATEAPMAVLERPELLRPIHEGLVAVLHGSAGTARASAPVGYRMAGKTGTAQRVTRRGNESLVLDELPFDLRHRALFIGYAPADAPELALALVVESGGSGSLTAAPVARRIFDAWLAEEPGAEQPRAAIPSEQAAATDSAAIDAAEQPPADPERQP
ncbi:MAG TPA: penicillin-binding protein 2 [Xanthomonadales bacterium]|nr:penicillin-binding protein 2 [Xanthomonadales bacterium]